jgi:hypothetical protein
MVGSPIPSATALTAHFDVSRWLCHRAQWPMYNGILMAFRSNVLFSQCLRYFRPQIMLIREEIKALLYAR